MTCTFPVYFGLNRHILFCEMFARQRFFLFSNIFRHSSARAKLINSIPTLTNSVADILKTSETNWAIERYKHSSFHLSLSLMMNHLRCTSRVNKCKFAIRFLVCMRAVCVTKHTGKVGTFKRYQWTRVPLRPISHKKKRSCFPTNKPIGWRRIAVLPFLLNFTTEKIKNCLFANKSTSHRESKCEVVLAELYWRWL